MTNWTPEQETAIKARNSNLLVAAAAGSGKTAVLVERIIRLIIDDQKDIDGILIVTFTHAAAGEMRERISSAILKALNEAGNNEAHLRRQLNLLSHASISTIHAFCTEVIHRYYYLLDIDPDFRVAEDNEGKLLQWEVMTDVFATEYRDNTEGFSILMEMFAGNRDDMPLQQLILRVYHFIQSQPYPLQWLNTKIADFNMDESAFLKSEWVLNLLRQIKIELTGAEDAFSQAIELAERPDGPTEYVNILAQDLNMVLSLGESLNQDPEVFWEMMKGVSYKRLPGKINPDCTAEVKEACQEQRKIGKDIIDKIKKDILSRDFRGYLTDLHELYPAMQYLGNLVEKFTYLYQKKKNELGIVDFNDLEHYALEILQHPEAAREYREKFAYIFVDEYQDSNGVQETLINFIKREDNLFFVGDVKQSIYRFRLADPGLFLDKYGSFDKEAGALNRVIDLSRNFRSCPNILSAVNYIFKNIMSRDFGEIEYDDQAALYPGKKEQEAENNKVELCLLEKQSYTQSEGESQADAADSVGDNQQTEALNADWQAEAWSFLEDLGAAELEARFAVTRIKELLKEKFYDEKSKKYRYYDYRDIVVLMRATAGRAPVFLETFVNEGIPAYADVNAGYFKALEISIFMNLLRVIDNKQQDIPLLSVLRSASLGGFSIEELIAIRRLSPTKTFYAALQQYAQEKNDALQMKISNFLKKIASWRAASRYMPIDEFINYLFTESGYYYYVGAMPGGLQRQANLRILLERARQFDKTSLSGLFNFIKFIDKLESSPGSDMGMAKILGENDNVVRIMSIHKSKGLEFPAVIITGLGRQFNRQDTNNVVLLHKDLGIGPRYVNPELRAYCDTIARMSIKNTIKTESLAEEMRILYVALTRPKNKLILVGSVKDLLKAVYKWSKKISTYNLSQAQCFLDWIGTVVFRHPEGKILRNLIIAEEGAAAFTINDDESQWEIRLVEPKDLVYQSHKQQVEPGKFKEKLFNFVPREDSLIKERLEERLNWKYDWREQEIIPAKISVTQVKELEYSNINQLLAGDDFLIEEPEFIRPGSNTDFSAGQKGSIMHTVLQYLYLEQVSSYAEIKKQITEMVNKEILLPQEAEIVDVTAIVNFFKSNLGQRLLAAQRVYRETPFKLAVSISDLFNNLKATDKNEKLLIQGVIDLYFYEGEEIVLVDYKTDNLRGDKGAILARRYGQQIGMYCYALEKILKHKVKESYFYLLSSSETILYKK